MLTGRVRTVGRSVVERRLGHVDPTRWCVLGLNELGAELVIAKCDSQAEAVERMEKLGATTYHHMFVIPPVRFRPKASRS